MLKVEKISDNRLDLELSGKLDSESMATALDEMTNKAEGIENGLMMYEIVDFNLPSLGAIGVEFSRFPSLFGLIKKFDRCAVLTDKNWLKKASVIEGALVPGLEIKAFDRDERKAAEAWLVS